MKTGHTKRLLPVLVLVSLGSSCGPAMIWHGRSPDRIHRVEAIEDEGRQLIRVNGEPGPSFDGVAVEGIVFSPDGRHLAYPARIGQAWTVVVDGKPQGHWEGIGPVVFSPDSTHLAFAVHRAGKWRVVRDGTPGSGYDELFSGGFGFDPSSEHFVFAAQRKGRAHVVVDDQQGPAYDRVGAITHGPGGRLAYVARMGLDARLVVDGVEGSPFEEIRSPVFDPVGGKIAYTARRGDAWFVVRGSKPGENWKAIEGLAWIEGGTRVVYAAERGGSAFVVVDDRVSESFDRVEGPVVSLDSAHFGYVAWVDGRARVVLDGKEMGEYASASGLALGPGGRWGYMVRQGEKTELITSRDHHFFDVAIPGSLVFNRDGEHWACLVGNLDKRKLYVVVDGIGTRSQVDWDELVAGVSRKPEQNGDALIRDLVRAEMEILLRR